MTELTDQELRDAAASDLNVLAILMLVGTTVFSFVNKWLGTMGWIAVALAISSTLFWTVGLFQRSAVVVQFVKIGFGFSGLAAPVVAAFGLVLGLLGYTWGWAVLGAAAFYFAFSVLGLEILARAEETGVVEEL